MTEDMRRKTAALIAELKKTSPLDSLKLFQSLMVSVVLTILSRKAIISELVSDTKQATLSVWQQTAV